MSIMVGVGRGATMGILFKDAAAIETLQAVDTLVIDKTGTLTEGKPRVTAVLPVTVSKKANCCAGLLPSNTPASIPWRRRSSPVAKERSISWPQVANFASTTGGGVEGVVEGRRVQIGKPALLEAAGVKIDTALLNQARQRQSQGETVVFVAIDGQFVGAIAVADPIRESAIEALQQLKQQGIEVWMLTGDNELTAQHVAQRLGIEHVEAGVKPEDKHRRVVALRQQGRKVAMAAMASTTHRRSRRPTLASRWGVAPMWRSKAPASRCSAATSARLCRRGTFPRRDAQYSAESVLCVRV